MRQGATLEWSGRSAGAVGGACAHSAQISPEKDFLSDGGTDTSGEMTTAASATACVGLRPMRLATSAKHGMRMAVMKP